MKKPVKIEFKLTEKNSVSAMFFPVDEWMIWSRYTTRARAEQALGTIKKKRKITNILITSLE